MAPAHVCREVELVYTVVAIERLHEAAVTGLIPQRFVIGDPRWPQVAAVAREIDALVALATTARTGRTSLEKLWAEAVFELERQENNPTAPSRLESLFAAPTMNGSLDLWPELGLVSEFGPDGSPVRGPVTVPARTRGRWVKVDMGLFKLRELSQDRATTQANLNGLEQSARSYWAGEECDWPTPELLCEGLDVDGWGGYSLPPGP